VQKNLGRFTEILGGGGEEKFIVCAAWIMYSEPSQPRVMEGRREFHAMSPRFQGQAFAQNLALTDALGRLAHDRGCTTAQLAIAWILHRGSDVVPLIGARRRDRLAESIGALDITLSRAELEVIETVVPANTVVGSRYDGNGMAMRDSEK
jgi:aryl-alcohol dehydrogenase-like predicted oxidoreductase